MWSMEAGRGRGGRPVGGAGRGFGASPETFWNLASLFVTFGVLTL